MEFSQPGEAELHPPAAPVFPLSLGPPYPVLHSATARARRLSPMQSRIPVMPSIGDLCSLKSVTFLIASVWLMGNTFGYRHPPHSESLYFNYTRNVSVVWMALEDAEYWFRVVHIWDYGRSSDRGIFVESVLVRGLEAWSWSCNHTWGKYALNASILDATSSGRLNYILLGVTNVVGKAFCISLLPSLKKCMPLCWQPAFCTTFSSNP